MKKITKKLKKELETEELFVCSYVRMVPSVEEMKKDADVFLEKYHELMVKDLEKNGFSVRRVFNNTDGIQYEAFFSEAELLNQLREIAVSLPKNDGNALEHAATKIKILLSDYAHYTRRD